MGLRGCYKICWPLSHKAADFATIFICPRVLQQAGSPRPPNGCFCLSTGLAKTINSSREMGTHTPVLLLHSRGGKDNNKDMELSLKPFLKSREGWENTGNEKQILFRGGFSGRFWGVTDACCEWEQRFVCRWSPFASPRTWRDLGPH